MGRLDDLERFQAPDRRAWREWLERNHDSSPGVWLVYYKKGSGKPGVIYSPRGQKMCEKLGIGDGHVTLTDEAGLVVAVAVLLKNNQQ